MRYLHSMMRVANLETALDFFCAKLGFCEIRLIYNEKGRFTLVFLAAPGDREQAASKGAPLVELTYNWDPEGYAGGRNFGHLAYGVDDIYAICEKLMAAGVVVNRPPRVPGVCDACGGELIQREDDKPEAIRTRLHAYNATCDPVLAYYRRQGLLREIDASGDPEAVFAQTRDVIRQLAAT